MKASHVTRLLLALCCYCLIPARAQAISRTLKAGDVLGVSENLILSGDDTLEVRFQGSAGQSFGAFLTKGIRLILEGEANDYVGKGMGGGEIFIRPPSEANFVAHENIIMGNTVLYKPAADASALAADGRRS